MRIVSRSGDARSLVELTRLAAILPHLAPFTIRRGTR